VSFEEQIISKYKISKHIFVPKYCVYHPSNIFHNIRGFENWGISLGYSSVLGGAYSVM